MFEELAPDYDRWNRILSWGLDGRWRSRAVQPLLDCRLVCDLGAGTGDMSWTLLRHERFMGRIIAVDPAPSLWRAGKARAPGTSSRVDFAVAEGEHLPLPGDACDGLMSAFVLRNFYDLDGAMREAARVVAPGGRAVFLEMGHPANRVWNLLFRFYFQRLAPAVASRLARRASAYRYLPGSLARFPAQDEIRMRFLANGWSRAEYNEYFGGAVVAYGLEK